MPDLDDLYETLEDLEDEIDSHDNHHSIGGGLFGHGGFFQPNHFEWPGFFVKPTPSNIDPYYTGKVKKWAVRLVVAVAVFIVALISVIVIFL